MKIRVLPLASVYLVYVFSSLFGTNYKRCIIINNALIFDIWGLHWDCFWLHGPHGIELFQEIKILPSVSGISATSLFKVWGLLFQKLLLFHVVLNPDIARSSYLNEICRLWVSLLSKGTTSHFIAHFVRWSLLLRCSVDFIPGTFLP
jgi:hypothetical protein